MSPYATIRLQLQLAREQLTAVAMTYMDEQKAAIEAAIRTAVEEFDFGAEIRHEVDLVLKQRVRHAVGVALLDLELLDRIEAATHATLRERYTGKETPNADPS